MDIDNTRRQDVNEGNHAPLFDNGFGRPPPGLIGDLGFNSIPYKQGNGPSSPPPGLGPPPFPYPIVQPGNNNVFFPVQPLHPFFQTPPPETFTYFSENTLEGTQDACGFVDIGANNYALHYQMQPETGDLNSSVRQLPLDRGCNESPSFQRVRTTSGVIEPIIENLMGSIGNSDGTYSHFGPTNNPLINGLPFGHVHQDNTNLLTRQAPILPTTATAASTVDSAVINSDPFNSSPEWEFQRRMESRIRQKQLQKKQQMTTTHVTVPFAENNATNVTQQIPPVAPNPTPKPKPEKPVAQSPRIETSVKPSYLEMLTKNCPKSNVSPTNTIKASGDGIDSGKGFGASTLQFQNLQHRKSLDGITLLSSSSPPASNPSTASSSPIIKPRGQQKGKENLNASGNTSGSSCSSISSSKRNTPVVTPIHQPNGHGGAAPKKENMTGSTNCWVTKLSGKVSSSVRSNEKSSSWKNGPTRGSSQFEFEVEDLDLTGEGVDDCSQKQQPGNSNSTEEKNGGSSTKKKVKRRFSTNGGSESGNNATASDRRSSTSESKATSINNSVVNMFARRNTAKEKSEKIRGRKEGPKCAIRRIRSYSEQWVLHLMKALTWLWMLLMNVTVLSASLAYRVMEDLLIWWKATAFPTFQKKFKMAKHKAYLAWKRIMNFRRRKEQAPPPKQPSTYDEFLSVLGPERNIVLPSTGDDALRRLLSVKGQDPYSILGVRSNSSDETIRRYYKKQAVLVHPDKNLTPGAEEAFKILAKAFEMVGEPEHRLKYHQQLLEAHAKERFIGEFGELFEELRKKMETVCSTIRCTKCKGRHKKNKTSRPIFAARYCAQCRIHHAGREGELWAEKIGTFSVTWQFYACMGNQVWEINEWGRCQRSSLTHLQPNTHNVVYRLVSSGQENCGRGRTSSSSGGSGPSSHSPQAEDDLLDPEMEDWDSLFNNLYRTSGNATNNFSNATHHKGCSKGSNSGSTFPQGMNNGMNCAPGTGKNKRKGKKK